MQQEINFTPIARRNDPQTSQIAAERTNKGKRGADMGYIVQFVKYNPRKTVGEICQLLINQGISFHKVTTYQKRLYDAAGQNLIRSVGERKCEETGHKARVWGCV